MGNKTEAGTQTIDCSLNTIELRLKEDPEMDSQEKKFSANELTPRSVKKRIKQAIDTILKRMKQICALLVCRTELESAGNSDASGRF